MVLNNGCFKSTGSRTQKLVGESNIRSSVTISIFPLHWFFSGLQESSDHHSGTICICLICTSPYTQTDEQENRYNNGISRISPTNTIPTIAPAEMPAWIVPLLQTSIVCRLPSTAFLTMTLKETLNLMLTPCASMTPQ